MSWKFADFVPTTIQPPASPVKPSSVSQPSSPAVNRTAAPMSAPQTPEKSAPATVWNFGNFTPTKLPPVSSPPRTPEKVQPSTAPATPAAHATATVTTSNISPATLAAPASTTVAETEHETEPAAPTPVAGSAEPAVVPEAAPAASPPVIEPEAVRTVPALEPISEPETTQKDESKKASEAPAAAAKTKGDVVPLPDLKPREPVYEEGYWTPETPDIRHYNMQLMFYFNNFAIQPMWNPNHDLQTVFNPSYPSRQQRRPQRQQRPPQPRLPTSENGWKRLTPAARAEASKQVQLILNRLVSTNCEEMTQEILKLNLNSQALLENLVEQIYEKAVKEVKYVKIYGKMCGRLEAAELHKRIEDQPEDSGITFRKLLTKHCSQAFDDDLAKWKNARSKNRDGLTQEQLDELDLELSKAKGRYLGNILFIAQLFLVKIVSVKVLTDCIIALIKSNEPPDEECIETLCKLMESVGKQLQEMLSQREDKAQFFMETLFKRFDRYSKMTDKYPPRIRFLLLGTIEMREEWSPARTSSPLIHAPTPQRSARHGITPSTSPIPRTTSATAPTPFPSTSRLGEEPDATPSVSPDQPKVTKEAQTKAMNTIIVELSQFVEGNDSEEFMTSMKESVTKDLYYMIVPAVLRFFLCDSANSGQEVLDRVKQLLVDFIDEEGVMIRDGLDFFRTEFNEYGEDSPVFAAQVTGSVFSALLKNDEDHEVFNAVLLCLAGFASDNPFWNAPNKTARSAGFAATTLAEMLSDIVKEQDKAQGGPYAILARMLDLQSVDVRAMMPDSPDPTRSLSLLAALLKEKGLDPLFPALCDPSIVTAPLTAPDMQPLSPEKVMDWIKRTKSEAQKGAATYFALLVAEEIMRVLKTTSKNGDIELAPWIPVFKALTPSTPVHYQVGLLNAICLCWSATGKKEGVLKSMAQLLKDENVVDLYSFNKWRIDSSDRNSTLKDEAFNNELTALF